MHADDLNRIEQALGLSLPAAYRATMLEYPFPPTHEAAQLWMPHDPAIVLEMRSRSGFCGPRAGRSRSNSSSPRAGSSGIGSRLPNVALHLTNDGRIARMGVRAICCTSLAGEPGR